jgi:hypothetical protein
MADWVGSSASAILFVCSLVGFAMLASLVVPYTAHNFLVVVTETAAGTDRVRWPGDSLIDWMGHALWLFALIALTAVPAGLLLPLFDPSILSDGPEPPSVRLVVAWLWFALPVALLSSMSAGSLVAVVRPAVLRDLFRVFPSTFVFYTVTAVGCYGALRLWELALLTGRISLIPVAAVAWAWGVLVYARLLGRLGWATSQLKDTRRKHRSGGFKRSLRKKIVVSDPWAVPAVEEEKPKPEALPEAAPKHVDDDEFGPATPYGLKDEPICQPPKFVLIEGSPFLDVKATPPARPVEEPAPLRPRVLDDDEPGEIGLAPEEAPAPESTPRLEVVPSSPDLRLTRDETWGPPAYPMLSGVYNFPFYLSSLRAFVILSLCWLVLGGWMGILIVLFPFR